MKLLFQSDDYGITEGVACGTLKGIRDGLIRNTGLFVNMPSSQLAAEEIKHYPHCCLGIDINLVAGRSVSPVDQVPHLVKPSGELFTSGEMRAKANIVPSESILHKMEEDPYPLDETLIEVENQVKLFMKMIGEKQRYINGHSLMTPNVYTALKTIAQKYEVPFTMQALKDYDVHWVNISWNVKPFPVEKQIQTDVEEGVLRVLPEVLDCEYAILFCHAGFVDEELFRCSTYTMIRAKDLFMACSPKIRDFIESNQIELITYDDLVKK